MNLARPGRSDGFLRGSMGVAIGPEGIETMASKPNKQKADNGGDDRDEAGRFVPGKSGGPGRPAGSPNQITAVVKADLLAAYHERGGKKYLAVLPDTLFVGLLGRILPREMLASEGSDRQELAQVNIQIEQQVIQLLERAGEIGIHPGLPGIGADVLDIEAADDENGEG